MDFKGTNSRQNSVRFHIIAVILKYKIGVSKGIGRKKIKLLQKNKVPSQKRNTSRIRFSRFISRKVRVFF